MKPMNFPARKLKRQLKAANVDLESHEANVQLEEARKIRTKKNRSKS